ncbi:hypothetical protein FALBO_15920, partial [Fusarium albosuccineum]
LPSPPPPLQLPAPRSPRSPRRLRRPNPTLLFLHSPKRHRCQLVVRLPCPSLPSLILLPPSHRQPLHWNPRHLLAKSRRRSEPRNARRRRARRRLLLLLPPRAARRKLLFQPQRSAPRL